MNHLSRFFAHRKQPTEMNTKKKTPRKQQPKLERRNAAKNFNYDAQPSSPESSPSSSILYTRSMDFYDRTSFRVEGVDGEFDDICRSLGLNGPEDFSIPAAAWEAMKVRSSSDVLPRLNISEFDETKVDDKIVVAESDDRVSVRDSPAETSGCCNIGDGGGKDKVLIRGFDEVSSCYTGGENRVPIRDVDETSGCLNTGGGGIKGFRPPMLKPPPGVRVSVLDSTCSTWDLLRDFAPEGEGKGKEREQEVEKKDGEEEEEEEEGEVGGVILKRDEEESAEVIGECSRSCSFTTFTTSQGDDSSSTTTEPRSNSISPNVRLKPVITPGSWQKGELLGRGSFGSVYEGISEDGFFFAVKQVSLLDQGSHGKQSVVQLEHEIALLSQFEHENVVRYIGTEMDESNLYIFIEFVTKGSLLSLYRRYKLRDSQVSAYTRQILNGLKYLHDRDIVHRDIKCANILVDANGSVKVADFGLAKAIKLNDAKSCQGTAFWMAPETWRADKSTLRMPLNMTDHVDALEMRMTTIEDSMCQALEEFRHNMLAEFAKLLNRPTDKRQHSSSIDESLSEFKMVKKVESLMFEVQDSSEAVKVKLVKLSMVGATIHWFNLLRETEEDLALLKLKEVLIERYDGGKATILRRVEGFTTNW